MYKDREKAKLASKERMRKYRQGVTKGVTKEGVTGQGVTYPILYALGDIKKRAKLRCICQNLSNHGVLKDVRYGVSGPTMDVVAELLEAF